jgi:hypothetical protein
MIASVALLLAWTAVHPDPVGPTTYSKSAIGHATLFELLDRLDIPVSAREGGSGAHLDPGSVLVIAEPRTDPGTLQEVEAMLGAQTVCCRSALAKPIPSGPTGSAKAGSFRNRTLRRCCDWWIPRPP